MPVLDLDQTSLKQGVLGLVIALTEIIRDTLRLQALKRVERASLTEQETDRLGRALADLDLALEQIKQEHGLSGAVADLRAGLDNTVDDLVHQLLHPDHHQLRPEGTRRYAA